MTHLFSNLPRHIPGADISIIGPRSAGKTTFMASLARWSNASSDTPILSVHPFDENAGRLIAMANDILENGLSIAPTRADEDANNLSRYTLLIELKPPLFQKRNIRLQVSFREYAGETLRDLCGGSSGMNLRSYLDDCASSSGLLLLIDGTSRAEQTERKY